MQRVVIFCLEYVKLRLALCFALQESGVMGSDLNAGKSEKLSEMLCYQVDREYVQHRKARHGQTLALPFHRAWIHRLKPGKERLYCAFSPSASHEWTILNSRIGRNYIVDTRIAVLSTNPCMF
jgi:hypothetical protein